MKYLFLIKKNFKFIRSFKQAVLRTIFIFISMPAVTWAGMKMDKEIEVDNLLVFKIIALFVASLCGGISSTFVKTSFDDGINHPNTFKILVGVCLGTFGGLAILDNSSFGIFSIILPTFVVASLGAPIMVFYLMWLSNAETQAEIKENILKVVRDKLGVGK